jgi:hypothetical protein
MSEMKNWKNEDYECAPLRETFPFLADFVVSPNFTRYRKQIKPN